MPPDRHQHVARVAQFMAEHTTNATDIDIDGEQSCPVCFEEYDIRRRLPLQIKDTKGCRHIFCKTCLKKLLRKHPKQSKRCPFCRTTWIAVDHDHAPQSIVSQAEHQPDVARLLHYTSVLENLVDVCEKEIAVHEREQAIDKQTISLMGAHNTHLVSACEDAWELNKKTTDLLTKALLEPVYDISRFNDRVDEFQELRQWLETILQRSNEALEAQSDPSELSNDAEAETQRGEVDPRAEDGTSEVFPSQR